MPLTRPARSQTTPGGASTTLLKLTWTDMTANDDRRPGIAPYRRVAGTHELLRDFASASGLSRSSLHEAMSGTKRK